MDERLLEFGRRAAGATHQANLEAGAREVVRALEQASVVSALLKGAAIAGWLYRGDEVRRYDDLDLLVAEPDLEAAGRVLESLGFQRRAAPEPLLRVDRHHRTWERQSDGVQVELHWTLVGIGVRPAVAWRVLRERTERISVGGEEMRVLSVAARTLHLALHAAQHEGVGKPREDLGRGIAQVDFRTWREARDLAVRLEAMSAFAAALRTSPEGVALATRLGLPAASAYWTLRAGGAPAGAGRVWYLRNASSWKDRWRLGMWFLAQARPTDRPPDRWRRVGRRLVRTGRPAEPWRWGRLRRGRPRE